MSRNRGEVSQLFVVDGSKALAAPGTKLVDLDVGQVGFFNPVTHEAFTSADAPKAKSFYVGVGLGGDVTKSIVGKVRNTYSVALQPYTPFLSNAFEITDFAPDCETEYQLKVRIRGGSTFARQGAREVVKSYSVLTSCCEDCTGCKNGKCNDLAVKQAREIANDPNGLFTVVLFNNADKTAEGAELAATGEIDPNDQAAIDAFIAADAEACLAIRMYSNAEACNEYCGIPENVGLNHTNAKPGTAITSIIGSLGYSDCTAAQIREVRETQNEQFSGADLAALDYWQQGWESGMYRQTQSGIALGGNRKTGFRPANCPGYHTVDLSFDTDEYDGWMKSTNQPNTLTIAIAFVDGDAEGALLNDLLGVLDIMYDTDMAAEYDVAYPSL